MSLFIDWQTTADGVETQVSVPVFNAALQLTFHGDVITDASWLVSESVLIGVVNEVANQVARYLMAPDSVELRVKLLVQGSEYARAVWLQLLRIPAGSILTYTDLAIQLGSGPRAIARACRDNPYAGLIPCHRVTAKNGVGGFMGQRTGPFVELKRRILEFESVRSAMVVE